MYKRRLRAAAACAGERRTRSPRDDYQANYELAIVSDLIRHLRHYYITALLPDNGHLNDVSLLSSQHTLFSLSARR